MPSAAAQPPPRRFATPLGLLTAALGLGLFLYTVNSVGWPTIASGLTRVGWYFIPVIALSGGRLLSRAASWRQCLDRPSDLPLSAAFGAVLMGDALGNLTPLGLFISEPTKIAVTRDRLPLLDAITSTTIDTLLYVLTVCIVIGAGCAVVLLQLDNLPDVVRWTSVGGLVGVTAIAGTMLGAIGADIRIMTPPLAWLARRGWLPSIVAARLSHLHTIEDRIYGFRERHTNRLATILGLQSLFHVAGVVEVLLVVTLLTGTSPGWRGAFVLEAVNRLVIVAFKFIPLRLGVDEAGSGLLAQTLAIGTGVGVTLAVVRKVRVLAWNAVGLVLLTMRNARGR